MGFVADALEVDIPFLAAHVKTKREAACLVRLGTNAHRMDVLLAVRVTVSHDHPRRGLLEYQRWYQVGTE